MAPINWFLSQHNYICRLQIVLTVKRLTTLGINKAEEFHSFQSVSRFSIKSLQYICIRQLVLRVDDTSDSSSTFLSLRYSRNTLSATFVPFLVFSLFFRSTKDFESFSDSSGTALPFSHKSVMSIAHEQNIICSKTLICRQLFAGHAVGSRLMKRKDKMHRMINANIGLLREFRKYCAQRTHQ